MIRFEKSEWTTIGGRELDGISIINENRCIAIRTNCDLMIVEFFTEDAPSSLAFKMKPGNDGEEWKVKVKFMDFIEKMIK